MPQTRQGFIDSLQQARLTWLSGTAYGAVPAGLFIGLYAGALPGSDGTAGGNEITSAARPAITFGAPVSDGSQRWYVTNTNAPSFTVPAGAAAGTVFGYGLFGTASGGVPNFVETLPSPVPYVVGQVVTIAIGSLRVFSERPVM